MQLAPPQAFAALGAACRDHDVLLICDEVATGFGRTGTLFASEQCELRPDLMALGKGLTAGYLAQSATVASGQVFDAFLGPDLSDRTLSHGHSFGGNALACAVALRHLELLDQWHVLENVRARSDELRALLDARIAPLPTVREVRLCGLMGGVELAPPADGLRWGRRACAEAVRRGVLLRPLGDVVVLMPPLTITSPELHRIVDALAGALASLEVSPQSGGAAVSWREWADAEADGIHAVGRWRAPRDLDAAGPEGKLAPDGRPVVSFASNDYLGLTQHPNVVAAARAALERWGAGSGSARLIVGIAPRALGARGGAGRLEARRARGALPDRVRREPRRAHLLRRPRRARRVRRAEPRIHHRRLPSGARRVRGRATRGSRARRRAARGRRRRAAGWSSPTRSSRWTAMSPPSPSSSTCARRRGALLVLDEAHAVLGPDPDVDVDGADVIRIGTLSKTLGSLGGFAAGRAAYTDLVVNRARSYIFTTASTPADSAAALAALAIVRSPRRRRPPGPPAITRRARPPGPPLTDRSRRARRRAGDAGRVGRAARAGDARAGDPPADGARGHVAAARRALGGPHAGAGRRARRRARCVRPPVSRPDTPRAS